MPLQPEDWNVVILGRWNPALFTPSGISQRLFHLPEGTPVEVFVAIDDIQPPRVRHEGITVFASFAQLTVSTDQCTFAQLDRARHTASEAIEQLPRTPLTAAGYNIRYRTDALPVALTERFSPELDRRFSDQDFDILGRQFHRVLRFRDGRLLVKVSSDPETKAELLLNFELQSRDSAALRNWLATPIDDVRAVVDRVLRTSLQLPEEAYVIDQPQHANVE
jgi:hypothetical protein